MQTCTNKDCRRELPIENFINYLGKPAKYCQDCRDDRKNKYQERLKRIAESSTKNTKQCYKCNKMCPIEEFVGGRRNCEKCSDDARTETDKPCGTNWQELCGQSKEKCKTCYDKSLASSNRAKDWNDKLNENIHPINVFKTTHKKYYFNCDNPECKHVYYDSLSHVVGRDSKCPYCSPSFIYHCDDIECKWCYYRSFASHPRAAADLTSRYR